MTHKLNRFFVKFVIYSNLFICSCSAQVCSDQLPVAFVALLKREFQSDPWWTFCATSTLVVEGCFSIISCLVAFTNSEIPSSNEWLICFSFCLLIGSRGEGQGRRFFCVTELSHRFLFRIHCLLLSNVPYLNTQYIVIL